MNKFFEDYTNKYPVSKTLRFRLIPQGNTESYVRERGLIQRDEEKAEAYKKMKDALDAYHKEYIERAMARAAERYELNKLSQSNKESFGPAALSAVLDAYKAMKNGRSKDSVQKKKNQEVYKKACDNARKALCSAAFFKNEIDFLTKADILKDSKKKPDGMESLDTWVSRYNEANADAHLSYDTIFKSFNVYFTSYHETRKNMYTNEEKATGIAYRIINENLPKFIDNIQVFEQIKSLFDSIMEIMRATCEELELLAYERLSDIFQLDGFISCLTQSGIDKYNELIGGYTNEKSKVRGLNEFINLYNQRTANKKEKLPFFKTLYKQILSDRDDLSFLPRAFDSTDKMYDAINSYYNLHILNHNPTAGSDPVNIFDDLLLLFNNFAKNEAAWEKIFISQDGLSVISQSLCGGYNIIREALQFGYTQDKEPRYEEKLRKAKNKSQREKLEKNMETFVKSPYFSVAELNCYLKKFSESLDVPLPEEALNVFNYALKVLQPCVENSKGEHKSYTAFNWLKEAYCPLKGELCVAHEKGYRPSKEVVERLKTFLDRLLGLIRALRPFVMRKNDEDLYEKNSEFYHSFCSLWNELSLFSRLYDAVRNYICQKSYSIEKFKLTFGYPTLADGWDENKEKTNGCVLLKKDGRYYLAITLKGEKTDLSSIPEASGTEPFYEKMIYKYFPGSEKMIPKCTVTKNGCKEHFDSGKAEPYILSNENRGSFSEQFIVEREIYDLYYPKSSEKPMFTEDYLKTTNDDAGHKKALKLWIAFCVRFLKTYVSTSIYDFSSLKSPDEYKNISDFYKDVKRLTYRIKFRSIPAKKIDELVEKGDLYLFEISNKDIGHETGTPNLHTLYWNAAFSQRNIIFPHIKLNGQAELFYRKASISKPIVHKAGSRLIGRVMTDGQTMPEHVYQSVCRIDNGSMGQEEADSETLACLRKVKSRRAEYDIIKDRRYMQDAFMLHIPLTFNFDAEDAAPKDMNQKLLKLAANSDDVRIIGIDRGERNLLYVSVIDKQGNILEQKSLNFVKGVDYHGKLDVREKERNLARESWQAIGKIADLKDGYLSYVIHLLTEIMVEHNAVIVMEDLNIGFKRGRFKVEKQIYQKFEKALITKLNYLCFKDFDKEEPGGVLNAFQLTNKFESFSKMGKQNGVIFYVPAWNTSKIDPVTGFVDTLKPKYTNRDDAQKFFRCFESIKWNERTASFEFTYKDNDTAKPWIIDTGSMDRFVYDAKANNGRGGTKKVNITVELQKAFDNVGINWQQDNLKSALCSSDSKNLLKTAMWCLKTVLSMRYSSAEEGRDFILSPVKMPDGRVFCSENAQDSLPRDADANGAYNIARKGLLLLKRVKDGLNNAEVISNSDWLNFAQRPDVVQAQQEKY